MITGMADVETDGQDYKALMEQMLEESHRRRVELGLQHHPANNTHHQTRAPLPLYQDVL